MSHTSISWWSINSWGRRSHWLRDVLDTSLKQRIFSEFWPTHKLMYQINYYLFIFIWKIPVFDYPFQQVIGIGFFILRAAKKTRPPVSQYAANFNERKRFQAALRNSHTCPKLLENSWRALHLLFSACFTLLWSTGRNPSFEDGPGPVSLATTLLSTSLDGQLSSALVNLCGL